MRGGQTIGILMAALGLSLAGCSREPEAPVAAPDLATPAAPPDAAEPPVPADSGLSIKRGVATLSKERLTFRHCEEQAELWMIDQTESTLSEIFATELKGGAVKLYIEAYGERAPVAEDIAAAKGYPGMFVLEEVLYAGIDAADRGCTQPAANYIVAARGNEPFWSVEVTESHMTWRQADEPKEIKLPSTVAQDAEGAVRYQAGDTEHDLELLLDAQPCRDSMSSEFFAYAARAVLDGMEFKGCARVGK